MKILLIDDNADVLDSCSRMLEVVGYDVDNAMAYDEALLAFSTFVYDVVVCDWDLMDPAGRTGGDLMEEMHRLRPGVRYILNSGLRRNVPDWIGSANKDAQRLLRMLKNDS